jgi:hypothetical protein
MAQKKFFVDINLNKNQLVNAVLHNTTPAAASGTEVSGQIIFDTGDSKLKYWNGTFWQSAETRFDGALQYKGSIAANAPAVSNPTSGDLYIFNSAGTATNFGGTVVQSGDFAIYNGSGWDIIQGNIVAATDSIAGIVELATNAETITGSDTSRVITPANLTAWQNQTDKTVVRKKVFSTQAISTSGTTLTHSLYDSDVQVQVYDSTNQIIEVLVTKGSGQITLTSNSSLTNCTVVISG